MAFVLLSRRLKPEAWLVVAWVLGWPLTTSAAPFAYIISRDRIAVLNTITLLDTITVLDTATNSVITRVPVGHDPVNPPSRVAVTPDGTRAYAMHRNGTVSVIDTATNRVTAAFRVEGVLSGAAGSFAFTPAGNRGYVSSHANSGGVVSVFETASNTVIATVDLGSFDAGALAVTPDGSRVYVGHRAVRAAGERVSVIDTATNRVTATVSAGIEESRFAAGTMAVSPDGTRVYVLWQCAGSLGCFGFSLGIITVLDTATNSVTVNVQVNGHAKDMAISPDGKRLYVLASPPPALSPDTVLVIDTATNRVTATVPLGFLLGFLLSNAAAVAVTPDGTRLYVTHDDDRVTVINTNTVGDPDPVFTRVPVGGISAGRLAIGPPENLLLGLSFNKREFAPGETFELDVIVANPVPAVADVYFGALLPAPAGPDHSCPGGDAAVFLADGFTDVVVRCLSAPPESFAPLGRNISIAVMPVTLVRDFFGLIWSPDLPAGAYTFFLAATLPGAFADGQIDPGDILALTADIVTFSGQ